MMRVCASNLLHLWAPGSTYNVFEDTISIAEVLFKKETSSARQHKEKKKANYPRSLETETHFQSLSKELCKAISLVVKSDISSKSFFDPSTLVVSSSYCYDCSVWNGFGKLNDDGSDRAYEEQTGETKRCRETIELRESW